MLFGATFVLVVVVVQQKLAMISYSQPPPKPWMMDPLSKINERRKEGKYH
jgi:hypothetical protein